MVSGLTNNTKNIVGKTLGTQASIWDHELSIKSNLIPSFGKDSRIAFSAEDMVLRPIEPINTLPSDSVDERPLPALEKLKFEVEPKDPGLDVPLEPDYGVTSLSNVQLSDLAEIVNVLGQNIALCLLSKQFSRKEWAINQVMELLNNDSVDSVSNIVFCVRRSSSEISIYVISASFDINIPQHQHFTFIVNFSVTWSEPAVGLSKKQ